MSWRLGRKLHSEGSWCCAGCVRGLRYVNWRLGQGGNSEMGNQDEVGLSQMSETGRQVRILNQGNKAPVMIFLGGQEFYKTCVLDNLIFLRCPQIYSTLNLYTHLNVE